MAAHGAALCLHLTAGADRRWETAIAALRAQGGLVTAEPGLWPIRADAAAPLHGDQVDMILPAAEAAACAERHIARWRSARAALDAALDAGEPRLAWALSRFRSRCGRDLGRLGRSRLLALLARQAALGGAEDAVASVAETLMTRARAARLLREALDGPALTAPPPLLAAAAAIAASAGPDETVDFWIAGCRRGEMAFALAAAAVRAGRGRGARLRVFAADPDPAMLKLGRGGVYPPASRAALAEAAHPAPGGRPALQTPRALLDVVTFVRDDLALGPPPGAVDLLTSDGLEPLLDAGGLWSHRRTLLAAVRPGGYVWSAPHGAPGPVEDWPDLGDGLRQRVTTIA
jgi:hypothetical protein